MWWSVTRWLHLLDQGKPFWGDDTKWHAGAHDEPREQHSRRNRHNNPKVRTRLVCEGTESRVAGTCWEKGEVTRDEIGKIVRGGTSTLISGMTWHVHSKLNLSTSHPNQFLHNCSFLLNQTLKLGGLCSYPSEIFSFVCAFLYLPIDILSQYLIPSHLYCNNLWMSSLPLGSPALISILIPILPGTW